MWLLLFGNDDGFQNHDSAPIVDFLKDFKMTPSIVLIGSTNEGKYQANDGRWLSWCTDCKNEHHERATIKRKQYATAFPKARLIDRTGRILPNNCRADFKNCPRHKASPYGHTCFPGPLARFAEDLADEIKRSTIYSLRYVQGKKKMKKKKKIK